MRTSASVLAFEPQWVFVCASLSSLTTAVSCVGGSTVAALTKGFVIHQDSHSWGCELYSAQDRAIHFITSVHTLQRSFMLWKIYQNPMLTLRYLSSHRQLSAGSTAPSVVSPADPSGPVHSLPSAEPRPPLLAAAPSHAGGTLQSYCV